MPAKPRRAVVEEAVANLPRLRVDQPALVAVSGGRDSVALLHALLRAGYRDLIVCHLDHALRKESEADAWFVSELAHRYHLPFEADRVDVRELAADRKLSIEAAAREARYEFFAQVAYAHWCPRVLLAHHGDDQVETLLLNLCRGTGRPGLAGMQRLSVRTVRGARLELHRPLLNVWRSDIEAYVAAHGLKFLEDASNADRQFTRNRVRHDLLPALETAFGRDVRRSLRRTAEILGAEEEYLDEQTPSMSPGPVAVATLKPLPVALQRRAIHAWLQTSGISDISFEDVESVRRLLTANSPAKVNLAGDRHVRRRSGVVFVE